MSEENLNLAKGDEPIPTIRMSEIGTTGLEVIDSQVDEQIKKELQWPESSLVYKKMSNDPIVRSGISLIEMMIGKIDWEVEEPENATEDQIKKTNFIRQCMSDMDHSWEDFLTEVVSYITYGFSVHEKVFRKRSKDKGSKYEDNLIGWKKLAIRSQDTLYQWKWDKEGRELTGVYQDLGRVNNYSDRFGTFLLNTKDPKGILIPRKKFLLFRYDGKRGNPIGNSPLNACYQPFMFRSIIEEQEAIGISRDMAGMPVLGLHPKYMSEDASPEDKAIYDYYKKVIANIQSNEQSGLIYPLMYNDAGKKIIEFELMGVQGGKQYDTDKIIKRYDDKILTALFADILKLGQQTHGSFSLAGAKTNIIAMNIETRLKEITSVINDDLIPQTFALNGWDDTVFPKITHSDIDEEDLDEFSKLIQRLGSSGYLPRTKNIVTQIVDRSGFTGSEEIEDMDDEKFEESFPNSTSRAGDGMKEGMPSGTGGADGGGDSSTTNNENA